MLVSVFFPTCRDTAHSSMRSSEEQDVSALAAKLHFRHLYSKNIKGALSIWPSLYRACTINSMCSRASRKHLRQQIRYAKFIFPQPGLPVGFLEFRKDIGQGTPRGRFPHRPGVIPPKILVPILLQQKCTISSRHKCTFLRQTCTIFCAAEM